MPAFAERRGGVYEGCAGSRSGRALPAEVTALPIGRFCNDWKLQGSVETNKTPIAPPGDAHGPSCPVLLLSRKDAPSRM